MKATIVRRFLIGGVLVCLVPFRAVFGQGTPRSSVKNVLVTPLLHGGALSDSLAHLIRRELADQYHIGLAAGDVSVTRQRADSADKPWTFESLRALAAAYGADGLVDVTATRVADGIQVTVSWGRAPFTQIDNTRRVAQGSLDELARNVARQLMRADWPAGVL